jgi:hypothetical protein
MERSGGGRLDGRTDDLKLEMEAYTRIPASDHWRSPKPNYSTPIDSYDSQNIERFLGVNWDVNVQDVKDSPKWGDFCKRFSAAKPQLAENNQLRIDLKFGKDVGQAVKAAQNIIHGTKTGKIASVAEGV